MAVEATNKNYLRVVKAFDADKGPVSTKERRGDCPECGAANGVVATELRNSSAMRVDGKCDSCGWEFSRAGLVPADAEEEA